MRGRSILLGVLLVGVAACGAEATPTTTVADSVTSVVPATTSTTPTTSTTSVPPTTVPPRRLFDGTFQQVLDASTNAWESQFMDPGGIVEHDGVLHMFYNGIERWPGEVHVGRATSTDGVTWTRTSDDWIYTAADVAWVPVTMFVSSAIVLADGTWALYFYTVVSPGTATGNEIGMATAPGADGPWTTSPGPVLTVGPVGAWDEVAVTNPSVVEVDGRYLMYYDGNRGDDPGRGDRSIGLAYSDDGRTWVKHDDPATTGALLAESDPVLAAGVEEWDSTRVFDANVVHDGSGFVMTYLTHRPDQRNARVDYVFGVATSDDGVHWTKDRGNPVLSSTRWGFQGVYLSTLARFDGRYLLYFDVQRGIGGKTAVWLMEHEGDLPL